MQFAARVWLFVVCLAACDNNGECHPPLSELPTVGMYSDPNALPLSDACLVGGLHDLKGRWFIVDPTQYFQFEYPRYVGSCDDGMRRHGRAIQYTSDTSTDGSMMFVSFMARARPSRSPRPQPATIAPGSSTSPRRRNRHSYR